MICAGASASMNLAAADPASWRSVAAYVAAPVFLAVITDKLALTCGSAEEDDDQPAC